MTPKKAGILKGLVLSAVIGFAVAGVGAASVGGASAAGPVSSAGAAKSLTYRSGGYTTGTLHYAFGLNGSSFIKGPNGTVPLTGGIDVAVDGGSGAITGRLTLNRTKGTMSILGFLPVEATVDFQQVGDTVGTYADGQITTTSTMYIKLPSFTLFGIPLGGGDQCRAKDPSKIEMRPGDGVFFNPLVGGDYTAANYSIAELENCGPLNGVLTAFASQSGNTIALKLSPKNA